MPPGTQPQPHSTQTPIINNMNLPLTAQQQMAALQQQQQQQQQQQGFGQQQQLALAAQLSQQFPQGILPAGSNNQLTPQQMQQIQLQRLAAAQAQMANQSHAGLNIQQGRPPNPAMINQAAALARAAAAAQAAQGGAQAQSPHLQQGTPQASAPNLTQTHNQGQTSQNFGSPHPHPSLQNATRPIPGTRPPMTLQQMLHNIQPHLARVAPDKVESVKAVLMRLASMSDEEREVAFRQVSLLSRGV